MTGTGSRTGNRSGGRERKLVVGAVSLAAALALAACGSSDDDKKDGGSAAKQDDKEQTTVRSRTFDTDIPGSWQIKGRPATRNAVVGTWKRSVDPDSTLVIAVTGKQRSTAEQSLTKLRDSLEAKPDFQQEAFDSVAVGKQTNATRFAFTLGGTKKVFILFEACGDKTVSLVGSAPTAKFDGVEKSFEETANGFDPNCAGTLEGAPESAAVDRALETLATSPSGDFDEVADELGVNDPAEEAPENEIESTPPEAAAADEDGEEEPGVEEEGAGDEAIEQEEGLEEEEAAPEDGAAPEEELAPEDGAEE